MRFDDGTLEVARVPETCTGAPENLQPLPGDRTVLMLNRSDGVWRPLTPFAGVLPLPDGETLPFEVAP